MPFSLRFNANPLLAKTGFGSVAVPGFAAGLAHVHGHYGSGYRGEKCCSWRQLAEYALTIGRSLRVTPSLANASVTKIDDQELNQPYAARLK